MNLQPPGIRPASENYHRPALLRLCLTGILIASCATGISINQETPGPADGSRSAGSQFEPANPYREFPPGAYIYFTLKKDSAAGAEFTDYFLKKFPAAVKIGKRERKILSRASLIDLAFYKGRFAAKLSGDGFPVFSGSLYFALSPAWKKISIEGAGSYWQAKKNSFSIALNKNTVFISNKGLFQEFSGSGKPQPDSNYAQWSKDAFASGWMHRPVVFDSLLERAGVFVKIPASGLYFFIFEDGNNCNCVFRLEMQNASTAKAVASMLVIARNNINSENLSRGGNRNITGLFFANPPSVDGKSLVLNLPAIPKKEFFEMAGAFMGAAK